MVQLSPANTVQKLCSQTLRKQVDFHPGALLFTVTPGDQCFQKYLQSVTSFKMSSWEWNAQPKMKNHSRRSGQNVEQTSKLISQHLKDTVTLHHVMP